MSILFLLLFFILFVVTIAYLLYRIILLDDELNDLYNTCYTYISNSFERNKKKNA